MQKQVRALIEAHISKHGQHVVCVNSSEGDPPDFQRFVYTIGNHGAGLPELLLIGESDDLYAGILNILGKVQRERGKPLEHGEMVDFGARLPARVLDAGQRGRDEFAVQAGVFYGTEAFCVRQIVLPDQNGRYPGDPQCLAPWSAQPILGLIH